MREWLKDKRIQAGLTQNELVSNIHISQNHYANIENGERCPSVTVAKKIAQALDFEWTRFYEDEQQDTA